MRIKSALMNGAIAAAVAVALFGASTAFAAANWNVTTTTSDGSPLNAVTLGSQIILDIHLTTTSFELISISGSVNNYDTSVVAFNSAPIFSTRLFYASDIPSFGLVSGHTQLASTVTDTSIQGPGQEDTFLAFAPTTLHLDRADGTVDPTPQFRLVYDAIGYGSTVMRVGTFSDYADVYASFPDAPVNNAEVAITVIPEPGTVLLVGLGLGWLSVCRRVRAGALPAS